MLAAQPPAEPSRSLAPFVIFPCPSYPALAKLALCMHTISFHKQGHSSSAPRAPCPVAPAASAPAQSLPGHIQKVWLQPSFAPARGWSAVLLLGLGLRSTLGPAGLWVLAGLCVLLDFGSRVDIGSLWNSGPAGL